MVRDLFAPGVEYLARLHAVRQKPLENKQARLLRLEFEVFVRAEHDANRLNSTGKLACRDIVVGGRLDPAVDPGVQPFIVALAVTRPTDPKSWLSLPGIARWVKIVFGPRDPTDMRNPFRSIFHFMPGDLIIDEFPYDMSEEWVTIGQAARQLKKSANTIRRRVKDFEPEHGGALVRRTNGGHRRINLLLLRNLL